MNDIVIYTCVIGKYDTPTDNFIKKEGYDYILISDEYIKTNCWTCVICDYKKDVKGLDNTKKQRYIKTHPCEIFKNYKVAVWIDANTDINDKLYKYIEDNMQNDLTFKKHPTRKCIYNEIKEVKLLKKENKNICDMLEKRYKSEGYPTNNGLFETNIIISHPDNQTIKLLFNEWWKEIKENSKRDQLSINYVLWKYNLQDFPNVVSTNYFKPKPHKRLK